MPGHSSEQHTRPSSPAAADPTRTTPAVEVTGRHAHETLQVAWVRSGAGIVYYGGGSHAVQEGSLIVIPPGEMHFGHSASRRGWTYTLFNPSPELLHAVGADTDVSGDSSCPDFAWAVSDDPSLVDPFARWARGLADRVCPIVLECLEHEALAGLVARSAHGRGLPRVGRESRAVRKVLRALEESPSERFTLDHLAGVAGISKYHLIRSFKHEVGLPPHAYQIRVRIGRAMRLLRDGHGISRAAFAAGFASQSHLHRHFKQILGITPGQFVQEQ